MRTIFLLLFFLIACQVTSPLAGKESVSPEGASQFEDVPKPFTPARPRSEAEEDRLTASTLYAEGRLLFWSEKYPQSLRRYQRAWRYDPTATTVLNDVLHVCRVLKRVDEFYRYAVLRAEQGGENDPLVLRDLAGHLMRRREFERSLKMFQRSLEAQKDNALRGATVVIQLQMGQLYLRIDDVNKAAQSFVAVRDALDDSKRHGLSEQLKKAVLNEEDRTYRLFAETFLEAQQYDAAEDAFRRVNRAKPNKTTFAYDMARVESGRGNNDKAIEHLNVYLDNGASDAQMAPYQLLADLLKKKLGDEDAAKETRRRLDELNEKKPTRPLKFHLAKTALDDGELDKAAGIYSALTKEETSADSYLALVDIYHRQKKAEKLADIIGETVAKAGTLQLLGDHVKKIADDKQMLDEMIAIVRERDKDESKSIGDGVGLAVALLAVESKRLDTADELFELALKASEPGKEQVMLTWGLAMFVSEKADRAVEIFQRAIKEKVAPTDSPNFYLRLAGALEFDEQIDEAIAMAKKAASMNQKSTWLQSRVPSIIYRARRYKEAETAYLDLLNRFDKNDSAEIRETMRTTRMALSNVCVMLKRMPEAEEWLEQVLDEFPEDIGAMNDLGYLWADQGKHLKRSLEMCKQAVAGEPENAAYLDSLGWAHYRLEQYDEAIKHLKKATGDEDPDGVILDHLGDAYHKSGQKEKALETWKRALEAFEEQEDAEFLQKTKDKIKEHSAE